jgi:AcrR family transcriptional regulator
MQRRPDRPGLPYIAAKVKLDEVADTLGLTRTALYRRWDTQHDFWADLSRYLVLEHDASERRDDLPWRAEPGPPLDLRRFPQVLEAFRTSIGGIQADLHADLRILVRASLFAYDDLPGMAAERRATDRQRIRDLAGHLAAIVHGLGYRFTEPLDAFGAATALWCLADGLTVRSWRQPGLADATISVDDGDGPAPWSLLAYCGRALLMEATTRGRLAADAPDGTTGPELADGAHDRPSAEWSAGQLKALEAAAGLFHERVDPAQPTDHDHEVSALGQITMASVARECGVSRRAVYNVWPSTDELRLDLLSALLSAERRAISLRLAPVIERDLAPELRASHVLSTLVRQPGAGQLWVGHVRLAYLVDGRHPGVQAASAAGAAGILDEFEHAVARLWPAPAGG